MENQNVQVVQKNDDNRKNGMIEKTIVWIGSIQSLIAHTLLFAVSFLVGIFHFLTWELVLLVLTTVVSLEAIYLAIFIQMTVNRHDQSLSVVKEDIDELGEDVEDIQEDIDELGEDVEDIQEEIEELAEDEGEEKAPSSGAETLDELIADIRQVLAKVEAFKNRGTAVSGGESSGHDAR